MSAFHPKRGLTAKSRSEPRVPLAAVAPDRGTEPPPRPVVTLSGANGSFYMKHMISAVFDDREDARRAVAELRSAGIPENAISLVGRPDDADPDHDGATKAGVAGAVAGGGVAGALLGVAALAIPGVGPLAAAGAIAASAVPTAAGVGAAVGATGGAIAKMLSDHDVEGRDAEYYEEHLHRGGIFVSVDTRQSEELSESAREILYRHGGHSASRPRAVTQ